MQLPYRFGRAELRHVERELRIEGEAVAIGGRAFDLLLALIEHRERVVTKDELLDLVWPGLVVEEHNLYVQINALRKLLGPRAIVTVPGRGYQFSLAVEGEQLGAVHTTDDRPPSSAQPVDTIKRPQTNLPAIGPRLLGREQELADLRSALANHRIVSIVGAGGIGKTSLAKVAAAERQSSFADGVWWVELAPLTDGDLVVSEVARVLRLSIEPGAAQERAVARLLRAQFALLLIDNCEHLLHAVSKLVAAIREEAPNVHVLTTSQEPLRTPDEHVFRLDPLRVPTSTEFAEVVGSPAVRLFVERARAADGRFKLNEENATGIAEVCKRLDGIPLALELAAARTSLLGVDGLLAHLDQRFDLLTGGPRSALRRHQTLRAALDFSHGLLSNEQKAVFRRIGVFAGSFSPEAAVDVACDESIRDWDVLDALGLLVDKSLVVAGSGARPRLYLLETTRAYALERLGEAGETGRMQERHAHAMARVFRRASEEFWEGPDEWWLDRYGPELENVRTALNWGMVGDVPLAIRLCGDSRPLWIQFALQDEGARRCDEALQRVDATTPALDVARLWTALAGMYLTTGRLLLLRGRDAAVRAAELLQGRGDDRTLALVLMGIAYSSHGPPDEVQIAALERLRQLDATKQPVRVQLQILMAEAFVSRGRGRFAEARETFERLSNLAAAHQYVHWELVNRYNVAEMTLVLGDLDGAIRMFRELAEDARNRRRDRPSALGGLATALLLNSEVVAGRQALTTVHPLLVQYEISGRYAATAALLAALEGRLELAAQLLGYAKLFIEGRIVDQEDPQSGKARERALQLISAKLPAPEIDTCMHRAATLSLEEAFRLVLEP